MSNDQETKEIRQDIQSTRADMSQTIDAIQEQLHPDNLKQQAQETIRSSISDGADTIVDYVRTNRSELSSTVMDAVKRNPVPAALVGLGLGWLALETLSDGSITSGRRSDDRWYSDNVDYPMQRYRQDGFQTGAYPHSARNPQNSQWDELGYTTYGSSTLVDRPQRSQSGSDEQSRLRDTAEGVQQKAVSAADTAQDKLAAAGSSVQETASSAADSVRDAASQAASAVQSAADSAVSQMQDGADQAQRYAGQARTQAGEHASQLGDQAQYYAEQSGRYARRTGRQVQRTVNDNPLVFGAVALGVGTLIAMMLPESQRENEWMGETRDELVDTAQSAAQDVAQRAQKVVDEVAPQVQQSVEKIVDDVKQTGKESVEELKKTGKAAAKEVKKTAKDAKGTAETQGKKAKADLKDRAQEAKNKAQDKAS